MDATSKTAPESTSLSEQAETSPPILVTPTKASSDSRVISHELSFSESIWMGPIPPPEILAGYEKALNGAADRILAMAETQQKHRHEMESKVLDSHIARSQQGLWCGLVVAIGGLSVSAFSIYWGYSTAGVLLGSGTLASLVGVFVYGKREQKEELNAKKEGRKPADKKALPQSKATAAQPKK